MTSRKFLETLGNDMAMKNADWLAEQQNTGVSLVLLDLRSGSQFSQGHIDGAVQVCINDLPDNLEKLIPSREHTAVVLCNGSIQSAMAVMYLRTEGYAKSYNLSGGYSSWIRNGRPVIQL